MGRRHTGTLPQVRFHKPSGLGRVQIRGKDFYVGRYGSPEAQERYQTLLIEYGYLRPLEPQEAPQTATASPGDIPAAPATTEPETPSPALPVGDLPAALTVGELARLYLLDIEATKPGFKKSSLWHGAIAASRAVQPFAAMPAAAFGSAALLKVQRTLIDTVIPPRKRKGKPAAAAGGKKLSRRYINDIVGRVRQMFHWGVLHEIVPDDRVKALEVVPALKHGQTKARETKRRKPVKPSIVKATLPYLTKEVADLIRFMRLTGCRPSEAARMKLCRIRDRDKPVWRYVPKRHKTAHMGKQRHIPIGPKAQAIVIAHCVGREPDDYVFTPERSLRRFTDKTGARVTQKKLSRRVGRKFTKDAILRAVARAIQKANAAADKTGGEPVPKWTPYQLRYTRLREIRRDGGQEAAQATAGHSKATMTDHYAPANWAKAAAAALENG